MVTRAFAIEDGNVSSSILTSRKTSYSDVDLKFAKAPTGDIYKKADLAAVKQSIKNLLMTNYAEKPFDPDYGADLNRFLFNIDTELDEEDIKDSIVRAIQLYEPRAKVEEVEVSIDGSAHNVFVRITFRILNTQTTETIELNLTRLR